MWSAGRRLLGYKDVFMPASETFADSKIVG